MSASDDKTTVERLPQAENVTGAFNPNHTEATRDLNENLERSESHPRNGSLIVDVPGFQIESELGRGGMGVVYKARQHGLNRTVALKMVLGGTHAKEDELIRFLAEAEIAARLQHQGIAQIYGIAHANGLPYFAMEYVDGGSLAERMRRGRLGIEEAVQIACFLAEAVGYAHKSGVVHRDLKPANILMTADGIPKITDFGLAKRLDTGVGVTQTGSILGTPSYMSPEQARGDIKSVGPSGDVYSLGSVLYELLTGRTPFRAENTMQLLSMVLHEVPTRPRSLNPAIPRDLETIVLKCLEKESEKRYASANELADELHRYQDGRPIAARRVGPIGTTWRWAKRNQTVAWLLAVVFGLLATVACGAIIAALQLNASARKVDDARIRELSVLKDVRQQVARLNAVGFDIHTRQGDLAAALHWSLRAWEADLQREADYDPTAEADHRLRVATSLDKFPELVGLCLVGQPVLDMDCEPKGRRVVAVVGDGTAQVWDVDRELRPVPPLKHDSRVSRARFSNDGSLIATATQGGKVYLWKSETGELLKTLPHEVAVEWLAFGPDNSRIVAAAGRQAIIWNLTTSEPIRSIRTDSEIRFVAFSPDGSKVVTAHGNQTTQVWETATGKALSPPLSQTQPNRPSEDYDDDLHKQARLRPEFSPDSQNLIFTDATSVVQWSTSGQRRFPLPSQAELGFHARYSPDGKQVFCVARGREILDIWSLNLQTGEFQKLGRSAPRQLSGIELPPTGSYCAFATTAGTLYFRNLTTGANFPAQVRTLNTVTRYRFADNGQRLLVASLDGTIRAVAVPGSRPVSNYAFDCGHSDRLTPWGHRYTADGNTMAIESPNGVRIAPRRESTKTLAVLGEAGTTPITFTPDNNHLLTHAKTAISIWDLRTFQAVAKIAPEPSPFLHGMLNQSGNFFGLLRENLSLELYSIPSGERVFGPVTAPRKGGVLVNPKGDRISVIAFNNFIQTWDVRTQKPFPEIDVQRDAIFYDNEFSPTTGRLATASTDLLVRQWDEDVQRPHGPTLTFDIPPEYLGYSNDGRRVIVADYSGVLSIFNATNGQLLGTNTAGGRTTDIAATPLPTSTAVIAFANSWKCLWESRDGHTVHCQFPLMSPIVRSWSIPRYAAGLEDVKPLAELISGYTADDEGKLMMLAPDEFLKNPEQYRRAWRGWRNLPRANETER